MCEEFAKRLTAIRKDKKITQKKAAEDLGVSQALLSHYEKGIRECGLGFIKKAAEYYGVSADYLLNLSATTSGSAISYEIPEISDMNIKSNGSIALSLAKRMAFNAIDLTYAHIDKMSNKELLNAFNNYLFLSVYRGFRLIYDSNPQNEESFFLVDKNDSPYLTLAAIEKNCAKISSSAKKVGNKAPALGQGIIEAEYPERAGGMLNLIKNAEGKIEK